MPSPPGSPRSPGTSATRGPVDAARVPRFAGWSTFARLPRRDEVDHCDIGVLGFPFDAGASYRPGARFGPAAIREGSRLLRPYHPGLEISPFAGVQVADCGDVVANPFDIAEALAQMTAATTALVATGATPVALGGDHTVALPMLRAVADRHGPAALLHFDAHLDTWDSYFGVAHTHGTVFRRAADEGLLDTSRLTHVGIRGPLYGPGDLAADAALGFQVVTSMDLEETSAREIAAGIAARIGDAPLYISVDIDVLDPAHAPGTGTPEAGGLTSRELLGILRGLAGCHLVGADVVEVSPAYDHAELTAIAAAHTAYELISLIAMHKEKNP
ncbi:agmatinase [Crossiella cryophila]|uniref:agmatinase n=1 Tax=Crossiella cryophila TaxID=43355 RepID=UPI0028A5E17C|nr:agmatinase [Crossiella cryophila]